MPKDGGAPECRHDLWKALQALPSEHPDADGQPGDVALGTRETFDESEFHGTVYSYKDDRYRTGHLLRREGRGCSRRQDDVDRAVHQFLGKLRQLIETSLREAIVDDDVLALDVPPLAEALLKRLDERRGGPARTEEPDPIHSPCRLCPGSERRKQDSGGQQQPKNTHAPGDAHRHRSSPCSTSTVTACRGLITPAVCRTKSVLSVVRQHGG